MSSETGYNAHPEIPELYDYVPAYNSRRDVEFYVDLCRQTGEALELGCGTGRVLIAAAEAGCRITGLDKSTHMLARCRAKLDALAGGARDRVMLVEADMTDFQLSRSFKLAIAPFRPIQHLTTVDEQLGFLRCVHQHLQPGGRLVPHDPLQGDPAFPAHPAPAPQPVAETRSEAVHTPWVTPSPKALADLVRGP